MALLKRKSLDPAKADLCHYYQQLAGIRKPEAAQTTEARHLRQETERERKVRIYVFARERDRCRCCRVRPAESRHELRFRSLGGKVTRENCVAVCGSGTTGCHGYLQAHAIWYAFEHPALGAEATVIFTPTTTAAADWLKVGIRESVSAPVMRDMECEV